MMITSRVFAFIYFCIVFFFTDSHNRPVSTRLMYRKYYLSFQNGVVCFPFTKMGLHFLQTPPRFSQ